MDQQLQALVARIPEKNGGKRPWGKHPQLKQDILTLYDSYPMGKKQEVGKALGLFSNQISRWLRSRTKERAGEKERRKRQSKLTLGGSVHLHGATVKRIPGALLISSLRGMREDNIVSKIKVIDSLSSAGYKDTDTIPHINTLPSIEEWEDIKAAILLVSDNYNLTKKETK